MSDDNYPGEDPRIVAFIEKYKEDMCEVLAECVNGGKPFTAQQIREIYIRFRASVEADPNVLRATAWANAAYDVARLVPYNSPAIDEILAKLKP
jgi:hypothetical protein